MPAPFVVLLSTYNGEKYLAEQLDSLLAQDYTDILIHIRDDGSADSTRLILDRYAARYKNISVVRGDNLGVAQSFFQLLQNADETADYFAFCDQDDVWLPNKLSRAASALSDIDPKTPALYFSSYSIVDEHLNFLGNFPAPKRVGFKSALVENVATGCTVVLNRAARTLVLWRLPEHVIMHDWWCYAVVCSMNGIICFDDKPTVLYRQHSANITGTSATFFGKMRRHWLQFMSRDERVISLTDQARELQRCFGNQMPDENKRVLARFLASKQSVWRRLIYLFLNNDVSRQSLVENAILKINIALNRY